MKQILYAKCSQERQAKYKIVTSIEEDEGKKYVRKKALDIKAIEHIDNMYNFYERHPEVNDNVKYAPCRKVAVGELEFDYIEGSSLQEIMTKHINCCEYEALKDDILDLRIIIYEMAQMKKFVSTEEFRNVFGVAGDKYEGETAYIDSNIDVIADNIIVSDEKKYIIDYEWIMPFAVPVKYILFRSLFFNAAIASLDDEMKTEIFEINGITSEDIKIFLSMEMHFQNYVSGLKLSEMHQLINKETFSFDEKQVKNACCKIEIKNERGETLYYKDISINLSETIEIQNENSVYISFSTKNVIIKLKRVTINDKQVCEVTTNSDMIICQDYYFINKPIVEINNIQCGTLVFEYELLALNDSLVETSVNINKDKKQLERGLLVTGDEKSLLEKQMLALGDEKSSLEKQLLALGDEKWKLEQANAEMKAYIEKCHNSKGWERFAKKRDLVK